MPKEKFSFKAVIKFLDKLCYVASPLGIVGIVFLTIVFLDNFGQYRNLVKGIEEHGVTFNATISGISEDYIFVDVFGQEDAADYYFARTQYYSRKTLAGMEEGDKIAIRAIPESSRLEVREPGETILIPYEKQVHNYIGFITRGPWAVWLLCLIFVSVHPEFLYLGFDFNKNAEGRS